MLAPLTCLRSTGPSTTAKLDPRPARTVELSFFGGLSLEETTNVVGLSPKTVRRDWTVAKSWLYEVRANRGNDFRKVAPLLKV